MVHVGNGETFGTKGSYESGARWAMTIPAYWIVGTGAVSRRTADLKGVPLLLRESGQTQLPWTEGIHGI